MLRPALLLATLCCAQFLAAQSAPRPAATQANVAYGENERQVLDFWRAESQRPAPLVVYFHGGGFRRGDKSNIGAGLLSRLLAAGVSVAAVNYRLVPAHPLPAAHQDACRALQFLRSKAKEWNLDATRIGVTGSSAGAQLSLYLALHDDMALPASPDPVLRQSTRAAAVAAESGQTSMDMDWWAANIPGYRMPPRSREEIYGSASDAEIRAIAGDISALALVTKDDPPLFMSYQMGPADAPPQEPQQAMQWMMHHVRFGLALQQRMEALNLECHLVYPGAAHPGEAARYADSAAFLSYADSAAFLIDKLARRR
ncbi:MAG: alpha/beta hydrolase [Acidobacteria bacterium]|nr:alpha/beta hydrolase [Acidobacteriota bacterium]